MIDQAYDCPFTYDLVTIQGFWCQMDRFGEEALKYYCFAEISAWKAASQGRILKTDQLNVRVIRGSS